MIFGVAVVALASCGGGTEQEAKITRKDANLNALAALLPGDKESTKDYQVYVDFSATMGRGIRDSK